MPVIAEPLAAFAPAELGCDALSVPRGLLGTDSAGDGGGRLVVDARQALQPAIPLGLRCLKRA